MKKTNDILNQIETVYDDEKSFKEILKQQLINLAKSGQWTIFTHQINGARDDFFETDPLDKLKGIFSYGLACRRYGSINGTTVMAGTVKNSKDHLLVPAIDDKTDEETKQAIIKEYDFENLIDTILNYDFHNFGKHGDNTYPTLLLAFPKYIEVDGKQVEFATSAYCKLRPDGRNKIEEMMHSKTNKYIFFDSQHFAVSWLDIFKDMERTEDGFDFRGFSSFPPEFNLLAFYKDESGKFHIYTPQNHISNENNKEKLQAYLQSAKDFISSHDCDLDEALLQKNILNSEIVYRKLDEDEFD